MLSVQSIEEFPQPITYETHQDGLEVLQNMTIAQRFTIENLFVDMINSVEQIDSHFGSNFLWKLLIVKAIQILEEWFSDCKRFSS
ncbi:unnamed protein product [Lathyrus oleraceus]